MPNYRWQLATVTACFVLTSCTRDRPADPQRPSAESADHASQVRPDSSPNVSESALSTNQGATRFPTTFAEWRAAAPRLDSSSGTELGRSDFATPWFVIGDSIAVGFDRGIRGVLITDLRTGAQERIGREGRGPLEFSVQAMIGRWAGDSVLVIDRGQLRATVVNVHTRAGRSFQFIERDTSSMGEPLGSLADQRIVFRSRAPNLEHGTDGMYRGLQVLRLKASTSDDASMSASVVGEAGIRVPFGGGRIIGSAPVQLAPLVAVGDKDVWWIPGGTDSLYAMGRTPPRFVGRVALPVKHFSRLEKSQLLTEHLSKFQKTPDVASAVAKILTIPDSISSIGGMLAGEHGSLWFRITEPGVRDVGSVWIEAGPDTLIARCFFVSPKRRVLAIGGSLTIVATRDSSDDTYGISVVKLSKSCSTGGMKLWNQDAGVARP
jgi:hypothetical protein